MINYNTLDDLSCDMQYLIVHLSNDIFVIFRETKSTLNTWVSDYIFDNEKVFLKILYKNRLLDLLIVCKSDMIYFLT